MSGRKAAAAERCQCAAAVYRRDTYRVDRGSKSGFAMHYQRGRCSRPAGTGTLCGQHARMEKDGRYVALFARPQPNPTNANAQDSQ